MYDFGAVQMFTLPDSKKPTGGNCRWVLGTETCTELVSKSEPHFHCPYRACIGLSSVRWRFRMCGIRFRYGTYPTTLPT